MKPRKQHDATQTTRTEAAAARQAEPSSALHLNPHQGVSALSVLSVFFFKSHKAAEHRNSPSAREG